MYMSYDLTLKLYAAYFQLGLKPIISMLDSSSSVFMDQSYIKATSWIVDYQRHLEKFGVIYAKFLFYVLFIVNIFILLISLTYFLFD